MNAALYRLITENPLSRSLLTPAIRVEDIVADAPDLVEGSTEAGQAIINALAKGHSIDWTAGGNGPAARDAHGLLCGNGPATDARLDFRRRKSEKNPVSAGCHCHTADKSAAGPVDAAFRRS